MPMMKHVGLFLLPVSLTAVGVAWYLDLFTQESPEPIRVTQAAAVVEPASVVAKMTFERLSYPETPMLAQLPREWPTAELSRDIGTFVDTEYASHKTVPGEQALVPKQTAQSELKQDDLGLSLDDLDLSSLSPDLALKVENALANNAQPTDSPIQVNDLERNAQQWHGRLPALNLQTHMYASDAKRRWVKINNAEYHQGDVVDGLVVLKEIQPQAVIVEFQGEQIRIPALYEWQG
ncbi:general secretion pathway protein GspB [Vibrio alfacsensis]|uniref:general secretion pathway protein GspB n=1 Tax=Vibrio alfacsensis TaxID=1074311 RepID=UPI0040688F87